MRNREWQKVIERERESKSERIEWWEIKTEKKKNRDYCQRRRGRKKEIGERERKKKERERNIYRERMRERAREWQNLGVVKN